MSGVSGLQATKNALLEALKTSAEQQRKIEDLQGGLDILHLEHEHEINVNAISRARIQELEDENEALEISLNSMDHFAAVAQKVEARNNELAAQVKDLQATLQRTQDAYVEALQEAGVWDANLGIVASIQAMAAEIEDLSEMVFSLKIQLRTVSRAFEERLEREKSE
jgi:hypothetical protein